MTNIVDLKAHHKEEQPDPEFVHRVFCTDHVDTMFTFTGSYEFEGSQWVIHIWARDFEEAQRKMAAVSSGKVDGKVFQTGPA